LRSSWHKFRSFSKDGINMRRKKSKKGFQKE